MNIGIQIYLQHIDFSSSDCIDGNGVIKFYELKSPPPRKKNYTYVKTSTRLIDPLEQSLGKLQCCSDILSTHWSSVSDLITQWLSNKAIGEYINKPLMSDNLKANCHQIWGIEDISLFGFYHQFLWRGPWLKNVLLFYNYKKLIHLLLYLNMVFIVDWICVLMPWSLIFNSSKNTSILLWY